MYNMPMTDAQLRSEIKRCEYCAEKPCKTACPADCSPADFMMAARGGMQQDYQRAAALILSSNPLGGVCGAVCPDYHCQKACSRQGFDTPIRIPAVQAAIIRKAREAGNKMTVAAPPVHNAKALIIGAGPSGWGAAAALASLGWKVDMLDASSQSGGACNLIPPHRLEGSILQADLDYLTSVYPIKVRHDITVSAPLSQYKNSYDAVIAAVGLTTPVVLNIPGKEAVHWGNGWLADTTTVDVWDKRVAVVGGAIGADIALTAQMLGAAHVEMIVLESLAEMPLTSTEREELLQSGVQITNRTRIAAVLHTDGQVTAIQTVPVYLPLGESFHPSRVKDEAGTLPQTRAFDVVFMAVGNKPSLPVDEPGVFYTGDMVNGPTTVVEAVAAGKNTAMTVEAARVGKEPPAFANPVKSNYVLSNLRVLPVPLHTDFFGRPLRSPFLLSAAPPTDGLEQMRLAYEAGWAGGIMKTAFHDVPIHIPGEYMTVFDDMTYGNCDNVSEHPLSRVVEEIKQLVKEYPDRLTMASTGGPVTGNDEADKAVWQSNTSMLEAAGVMGIEYSLSCPQGGDGTHGDIVSQNAELTAKIVDWVMQSGKADIPKLFKLTGAVTSIVPIVDAIKAVLERYPGKAAGITLANTFPAMSFRDRSLNRWDEGVLYGMSGGGVLPISYLTLSRAGGRGVVISGNGGAMNYKAAADFLALGASTVQFCTIVEKWGYGIINELESGLSHLMQTRGIGSVQELIGIAQPTPVRDFMDLPVSDKMPLLNAPVCVKCGNCTRCPYLAITLDGEGLPVIDKERCVGCSLCTWRCFTGALSMQDK